MIPMTVSSLTLIRTWGEIKEVRMERTAHGTFRMVLSVERQPEPVVVFTARYEPKEFKNLEPAIGFIKKRLPEVRQVTVDVYPTEDGTT